MAKGIGHDAWEGGIGSFFFRVVGEIGFT